MGAGPLKRRSVQKRLREVRAAKAAATSIEWTDPIPEWAGPLLRYLGPGPFVTLLRCRTPEQEQIVTKADYLAELAEGEPDTREDSWALFCRIRRGEKVFAEPDYSPPASPTAQAPLPDSLADGPRQRRDLEAERRATDEVERELDRYRRAAADPENVHYY